jgi:hypothetical protein
MKKVKKVTQKELLNEKNNLVNEAMKFDLDKLNFDSINIKNPNSVNGEKKSSLYKEKLNKQQRKQTRNKRNKLVNNVIFYAKNKQVKELKETIKEFNSFYKETYLLNDNSINSIASKNSDKDTIEKIAFFFNIVKGMK